MQPPQIILEIGTNYYELAALRYMEPLDVAYMMIDAAKECDATAVKFQWYKAEKLVRPGVPAYWQTKDTQFEVFKRQDAFGFAEYQALAAHCETLGIEFLCTAFDEHSLEQVNYLVRRHKVASADITHAPMLEQVASYGKPVLLSTGAATEAEIDAALEILGPKIPVTLLHCVLDYPTESYHANLIRIADLRKRYPDIPVGYSDHCMFDTSILLAAWLLGAEIIEKHFTLTHQAKGNDHEHAASFKEAMQFNCLLKSMCMAIDGCADPTIPRNLARRGVYLVKDVDAGDFMRLEDVEFVRPQQKGISPMDFYHKVKAGCRYIGSMKKGEQF